MNCRVQNNDNIDDDNDDNSNTPQRFVEHVVGLTTEVVEVLPRTGFRRLFLSAT